MLAGCALGALALVGGCEGTLGPGQKVYSVLGSGTTQPPKGEAAEPLAGGAAAQTRALGEGAEAAVDQRGAADFFEPGSGVFTGMPAARPAGAGPGTGEITLNFENTSLQEVVKVVLGDLLGLNYVVDPQVAGTVTLQTSRPLAREALIPTLETLLGMNAAALVRGSDGLYRVVPSELATQAAGSPRIGGGALPAGYGVQVVPLRHISAIEMQKILEPFARPTNLVRVDVPRNLLVLAGSSHELADLVETVEVFDVDWLEGMSVGLFTPDFVDAKTLADDLASIFGDQAEGPLAGLVRFVLIERLDALLVISPRPEYLQKASEWIDRLDLDTGTAGQRLFVYHVQNGKAVELAEVLTQVFREEIAERIIEEAELAPGLEPVTLRDEAPAEPAPGSADQPERGAPRRAPTPTAPPIVSGGRQSTGFGEGLAIDEGAAIRIIADEVNNALVILATAQQYRQVEAAIRRLDIVPLQVLIEATIAEVSLEGELELGLEWFFKNHVGSSMTGEGKLNLTGLSALTPGFSYAIIDQASQVRLVLNALAKESQLNIISSPSLMVLNNQQATIQVGDQVPVTTQLQQSTTGVSNIVNSVEYRDTGVLLTVTPRVNAGGLITMEIEQEVSNVDRESLPEDGQTLTPTISQRRINSTVAIQSGETVVLGGLIRDLKDDDDAGLPFLHTIPMVGLLFGRKAERAARTELVVLITPRAIQNAREARVVTDEFRRKMESLKPLVPGPELLGEASPVAAEAEAKAEAEERVVTPEAPQP